MSGLGWRSPTVTGRSGEGSDWDVYVCVCVKGEEVDVGGVGWGGNVWQMTDL